MHIPDVLYLGFLKFLVSDGAELRDHTHQKASDFLSPPLHHVLDRALFFNPLMIGSPVVRGFWACLCLLVCYIMNWGERT